MTDTPKIVKARRAMKYKALWKAEAERHEATLVVLRNVRSTWLSLAVIGWLSFIILVIRMMVVAK